MEKDTLRTILGIAAGGIAGSRGVRQPSDKSSLADTFVGAVLGLFAADVVSAFDRLADGSQRADLGEEINNYTQELEVREFRGMMRGVFFIMAFQEALSETFDRLPSSEPPRVEDLPILLAKNRELCLSLFERKLRLSYESANESANAFALEAGIPFELNLNSTNDCKLGELTFTKLIVRAESSVEE